MAEKSAFDPKNIARLSTEKQGILEELGLPPKVIKFFRENAKNIKIAVACVAVAIIAWEFYGYYKDNQIDKSTALLARAMQEKTDESRFSELDGVVKKFPRTDAAVWSRIEQGHIAFNSENYDDAIAKYKAVLDKLSTKSPLVPLLKFSLGQAYENKGDFENAVAVYSSLSGISGFSGKGYLALGRIYEAQGGAEKAKEVYQKIIDQELLTGPNRILVEDKLATL